MPHNKDAPAFALTEGRDEMQKRSSLGWLGRFWLAYKLRLRRRRFLLRALRKRRSLAIVQDHTSTIQPDDVICVVVVRNEAGRLPHFLDHYRRLGVGHFLFIDNASTDGSRDLLLGQSDISLWTTGASYKAARFGMDWVNWVLLRYGAGHWCLTVDADELLVFPSHDGRSLADLGTALEREGQTSFGALMVDLYPQGPVSDAVFASGDNPLETLTHFDAGPYRSTYKHDYQNLWVQGGVRDRAFFAHDPRRAPTMSKTPFVKWRRRYAYVSSTHSILPRPLNHVYSEPNVRRETGVLLHTKFLPEIMEKSSEERQRKEHFANSSLYNAYYDAVIGGPDLWTETSVRYEGWKQLCHLGLMTDVAREP